MSSFEVWAAGRPLSGVSPEALLAKVQALFPKATPAQLARFTAGTRFILTRVPDEATAKRVVEALNKAGAPSEYVAANAQPPAASLPGAERAEAPAKATTAPQPGRAPTKPSGAVNRSAMAGGRKPPSSVPPRKPDSKRPSLLGRTFMVIAWLLTVGTIVNLLTRDWRAIITLPALAIAIPAIGRRIPIKAQAAILAGIVLVGLLGKAAIGIQHWSEHRHMVSTFEKERATILGAMKTDIAEDRPAAALALSEKWKNVDDDEVAALGTTALKNLRATVAKGDATALRGFSEKDFPQYQELFTKLTSVAREQQEAAHRIAARTVSDDCLQDSECLYKKAGADGKIACSDALSSLAEKAALHAYRWTSTLSRYSEYRYKRPGAITYLGNEMEFQNGVGLWVHQRYECDYDVVSRKVLDGRILGAAR